MSPDVDPARSAGGTTGAVPSRHSLEHAGLPTRLASMLYEGVLLFGVVFVAAYLYSALTQQRNAMEGRFGLQFFLFLVFGVYFAWFWSHGGQTVAMKAWRIRLVRTDGSALGQGRALLRYLLCWLWFLPALVAARLAELHDGPAIFGLISVGMVVYAAASRLHPDRQFPHDALCGTRLVRWDPLAR